jgi:uncharacterized membrane protein
MNKQLMTALVFGALVSTSAVAADKMEKKAEREKCYGVSKAEKNDCASKDGSHSCAGSAKKDGDVNEWVYVPKGLCEKLVGGIKG